VTGFLPGSGGVTTSGAKTPLCIGLYLIPTFITLLSSYTSYTQLQLEHETPVFDRDLSEIAPSQPPKNLRETCEKNTYGKTF